MNYRTEIREMVKTQIMARGIRDNRVLKAMLKVPRHLFVPPNLRKLAYDDRPLPIGEDQTISQPYIVALMTQCLDLKNEDRVLEIGTGSGYQTAILAEIAKEVYTVERFSSLLKRAKQVLDELGYGNIHFKVGDGTMGWKEHAPYDKIIVTAGAPSVPEPLFSQLKEGGRIVIPVGSRYSQDLKIVKKEKGQIQMEDVCGCIFVPLVGEFGWKED